MCVWEWVVVGVVWTAGNRLSAFAWIVPRCQVITEDQRTLGAIDAFKSSDFARVGCFPP